jgi:outer membrane receptor protein involved in Fe transport
MHFVRGKIMQFKHALMAAAIVSLFSTPAFAVSDAEWAVLKEEISHMKAAYEARIAELEKRVKAAEEKPVPAGQPVAQAAPEKAGAGRFNPDVSLILQGRYAHRDEVDERHLTGFMPAGHEHGAERGFSIDHTELAMSASVDQLFKGYANIALADEEVAVEEAWFQTLGLGNGLTLKGGRFLSAIGYQNEQHPHAWDFADNSLMYQALFGEGYAQDGLQLKWVAPTDLFIEPFVEIGRGANFPGSERNENGIGAYAIGVHVGGDVGVSSSWRAGFSRLSTKARDREFEGHDAADAEVLGAFSGDSRTWLADMVWKWAPDGNARERNLKLAAEYFRRQESGTLTCDDAGPLPSTCTGGLSGPYQSSQSGLYALAVYQFMPQWRAGYRYDRLWRGDADFLGTDIGATIASLSDYDPSRHSLMLDWSPSEFSRLRLQYSRDGSMARQDENQWFVQYIHSLGAHGAHKF